MKTLNIVMQEAMNKLCSDNARKIQFSLLEMTNQPNHSLHLYCHVTEDTLAEEMKKMLQKYV